MDYEVVYSSSYTNMPAFIYIYLPIVITAAVIFIILLINKSKILSNPKVNRIIIITLVFALLFGIENAYSYISNINSLEVGDYELLEGKVENFSPASASKKGYESFQVNGKTFLYANGLLTGGLSHSIEDSGVKNGSLVKVYYRHDAILRIEVKR